jgi:hypothetical protein
MSDLYIPTIGLPILLQENMWTDPGNIQIAHRHRNVIIVTEAEQFLFWEFINGIFIAVCRLSGVSSMPTPATSLPSRPKAASVCVAAWLSPVAEFVDP